MFEAAELGQKLSKEAYEDRVPGIREALLDAQARLADAGFSVVIVIAGAEGSGKGESLHNLLEWLDAQAVPSGASIRTSWAQPNVWGGGALVLRSLHR